MTNDFKQLATIYAHDAGQTYGFDVFTKGVIQNAWLMGRADAEAEILALTHDVAEGVRANFNWAREKFELKGMLASKDKELVVLEAQLAECREALTRVRKWIRPGDEEGFTWNNKEFIVNVTEEALARTPADSLRVREAELAVIEAARLVADDIHWNDLKRALTSLDSAKKGGG